MTIIQIIPNPHDLWADFEVENKNGDTWTRQKRVFAFGLTEEGLILPLCRSSIGLADPESLSEPRYSFLELTDMEIDV